MTTASLTMALDSTASFDAHCDRIDDSGNLKQIMKDNGLTSFSQLAFVCGSNSHQNLSLLLFALSSMEVRHSVWQNTQRSGDFTSRPQLL